MARRKAITNVELLMLQQEAKQRFDKILLDIQALPEIKHDPQALKLCRDFRYCLKPVGSKDVTNLPYYAPQPEAFSLSNKILCVISLISYTVQLLWKLYDGDKDLNIPISSNLVRLEGYIKNGLDAYEIAGKKYNPGYWLEKKEIE